MQKEVSPGLVAGVVILILAVLGFFLFRTFKAKSGGGSANPYSSGKPNLPPGATTDAQGRINFNSAGGAGRPGGPMRPGGPGGPMGAPGGPMGSGGPGR